MGLHFYLDSSIPAVNDWAKEKQSPYVAAK